MLSDTDKAKIIARYTSRFSEHGNHASALNTGNPDRYKLQHNVHYSVGNPNGKLVLDIGCGLAHYYDYLLAHNIHCSYVGYDIVPCFVTANRERFAAARFELRDVFQQGLDVDPDFAVMCQVFNNRYTDDSNAQVVKNALATIFPHVRIALSVDMLSSYVNYREDHLFYFSPEEMFAYARTLTPFVQLRHDYSPHHFTLILYRHGATL